MMTRRAIIGSPAPEREECEPPINGRGDTILVDIESQIEFLFHWCVCLFSVVQLQPRKRSGLVRLYSTSKRRSSPRVNMNGKHTPFQPSAGPPTARPQP